MKNPKSRRTVSEWLRASDPWTNAVTHRLAIPLIHLSLWLKLSPNQVTTLSTICFIVGVCIFAANPGSVTHVLIMAGVLQVAYALDAADGAVARITNRTSSFGRWYDLSLDRVAHIIVVAIPSIAFWNSGKSSLSYIAYHGLVFMLLLLTLAYDSGLNLKAALDMSSKPDGSESHRVGVLRKGVTTLADYGLFLFVFSLSFAVPFWEEVIAVEVGIYAVACGALVLRTYIAGLRLQGGGFASGGR